jgi:hypothetical protein
VNINPQKTRIVHVRHGFEFLGYNLAHYKTMASRPNALSGGFNRPDTNGVGHDSDDVGTWRADLYGAAG